MSRLSETQKRSSINYSQIPLGTIDYLLSFCLGFVIGFLVFHIFYRVMILSVFGGFVFGLVNIVKSSKGAIQKRKTKLRMAFFDLMEAMSVSMRAGSTILGSLQNAKQDLLLIYPTDSDIISELDLIIGRFENAVPLSQGFSDLAERSGLDDVKNFAAIYATIEGKSGKADEIIRETQQIISDKMEIEMEIETLMTAAKSEVNIMLLMPLVILGVIGYAGAGFMDAIYTTVAGRFVSTAGLIIFVISYIMARRFSNVKL